MKQQQSASAFLADAPDGNPNPVLFMGPDGALAYANAACACLLETWDIDVGDRVPEGFLSMALGAVSEGGKGKFTVRCGGRFYSFRVSLPEDRAHIGLFGNDVTEETVASERLSESERHFRQLADGIPQLVWTVRSDGIVDYCSKRASEYGDITRRDDGTWDLMQLVHPDDVGQTNWAWKQAIATGEVYEVEHRLRMKGGEWRWHLCRSAPLTDEDGHVTRWLGSSTDIDDQKRVEEDLRRNGERLRLAMEAGYLGAVEYDLESGYVMGDEVAQAISGIIADRIEFEKALLIFHPEDARRLEEAMREAADPCKATPIDLEVRIVEADGTFRWISVIGKPYFAQEPPTEPAIRIMAALMDITERKRAAEELHESQERFAAFMRNLPAAAWIKDLEGRYIYANAEAERSFATPLPVLRGRTDDEVFPQETARQFRENDLRVISENDPLHTTETLRHDDGIDHYSIVRKFALCNREGRIGYLGGIAFDITERMAIENALRVSEERLRLAMEAGSLGIWNFDLNGSRLTNDKQVKSIATMLEEQIASDKAFQYVHPDDRRMAARKMEEAIAPGNPGSVDVECRIVRPDGTLRWIAVSGRSHFEGEGSERRAVRLAGTVRDITERKLAEQALRESEERCRQFFDLGLFGAAEADPVTRRLLRVNQRYCEITGYSSEELLSLPYAELTHPEDRGEDSEKISRMLRGETIEYNSEKRYIRKDGRVIWVHVVARPIRDVDGKVLRTLAVITDISRRKRSERALSESEEKFRILAEHAPVVIGIVRGTHFLYVNPFMEKLSGYSRDELLTYDIRHFLHPDSMEMVVDRAIRRQRGEPLPTNYDFVMLTKAGEARWIHLSSSAILFHGEPALVGAGIDITELKRTEEQLAVSKHRLVLATEVAQVGHWHRNLRTDQMVWDAPCARILGVNPEAEPSLSYLESVLYPEDRERHSAAIAQSIERHEPYQIEFRVTAADGGTKWILGKGQPFYSADREPAEMIGVLLDITERKLREQMLTRTAADLERSNKDLERFAYVASHDLQEPLRTIRGFMQLLEKKYRDKLDEEAREYIDFAVRGAAKMQELIQDLLSYSRITSGGIALQATSMEDMFEEVHASLLVAIKESGAEVSHDALPTVRADPAQVRQLVQNLLSNAIKFRRSDIAPRIHLSVKPRDGMWLFALQDNGIGIEPKYFERIFTIFQRLHSGDQYSGTGIGLAVCKRIVERHGGQICVDSEAGRGTAFYFTLPRA